MNIFNYESITEPFERILHHLFYDGIENNLIIIKKLRRLRGISFYYFETKKREIRLLKKKCMYIAQQKLTYTFIMYPHLRDRNVHNRRTLKLK